MGDNASTRNLFEHRKADVDVHTTLQATPWIDLGDACHGPVDFMHELTARTGGTSVEFDIETSPDARDATVTAVKSDFAALTTAGQIQMHTAASGVKRFVRWKWTVVGAVTVATANLLVQAARRS